MNWNNLTVTANTNVNGVKTPIQNLNVSFVLYDSSLQSFFYIDKMTNENGIAVLPSKSSLMQERVEIRKQTTEEKNYGSCIGKEKETARYSTSVLTEETFSSSTVSRDDYWYAASEYNGDGFSSESANMATSSIELIYDMNEDGQRATMNSTTINVNVKRNAISVTEFYVTYWIYDNNSTIIKSDIIKGSNGTVIINEIPNGSKKYILHAYEINTNQQYYNINTTFYVLVSGTDNQTIINLTGTNGFYFKINSVSNCDVLFYYIGKKIDVYPIRLYFKNSNNVIISDSPSTGYTITNDSEINKAGKCNTRYLYLVSNGNNSTIRNYFDSAITSFDLFKYMGGIINSAELLMPKKNYEVEIPPVYDTIDYIYEEGHTVVYNLPNTNIDINYVAWDSEGNPTFYYNKNLTSNSNTSLTITNSEISCSTINRNWFYKCLAGHCGGSGSNFLKFNLTKHHYNKSITPFIVSSYSLTNTAEPYTNTSSTINFLYCCKNTMNGSTMIPIDEVRKTFTLIREEDAVFRRKEIQDYVRGFSYNYTGNRNEKDSNLLNSIYETTAATEEGRALPSNIDFENFTLTNLLKTPPSKSYFYTESINALNHSSESEANLSQFKSNFIDELRKGADYYTKYTLPDSISSQFTNNNSHCYVMDRTILPNIAEAPHYLYFYNNYQGNSLQPPLSLLLCTTIYVTLEKIGNPTQINLQYAIDDRNWANYSINTKIYLVEGSYVRFRARSTNETISIDSNNYYRFIVGNDYKEHDYQISFSDLLNTGFSTNKIGYDVIVGGVISSLIDSLTNSEATVGQYCFYKLFNEAKITSCKGINENKIFSHLDLDLKTIPNHCYSEMFSSTPFLEIGPSISATTVGNFSMSQMFDNSYIYTLFDKTLYFADATDFCCYKMFFNSNYNDDLSIEATTSSHRCFSQMFESTTNLKNGKIELENIKNFANFSCYKMFANSSLTRFPKFNNSINSIGNNAFEQAFLFGKVTSVNFTISTNGNVGENSCSEMFAFLNPSNSCNITSMHLNASNLGTKCYYKMFFSAKNLTGTFNFNIPSFISVSGCTSMFQNATGLGIICDILSPTSLNNACYSHMFENCAFSSPYNAPELPATELAEECYSYMLKGSNITGHTNMYYPEFKDTQYNPTTYVLNATILPKKCYYAMYQDSKLKYVSSIITTGLTAAGIQSCGYMFYNTPIKTENRARAIIRDDGLYMTFRQFNHKWYQLAHAVCTKGDSSYEDKFMHIGEDIFLKNGNVCLLTGFTALLINQTVWHADSNPDLNLTLPNGTYNFLHNKCNFLKSQITYNNSITKRINNSSYTTGQNYGEYLNNEGKIYLFNNYHYNICITINDHAYALIDVYNYFSNSEISTFPSGYRPFIWAKLPNPTFDFDNRDYLEIGKYASISFEENSPGYSLSASYTSYLDNNVVHTYNYLAASEIVKLNATTLSEKCYEYMFSNCPKLVCGHNFKFGNLTTLAPRCFSHMFDGCKKLRTITPDINKFSSQAEYAFEYMYANCYEDDVIDWGESPLDKGLDRICNPSDIFTKYDAEQNNDHTYYGHYFDVSEKSPQVDTICCQYMPNVDIPFWNEDGLYTKEYEERGYYYFNQPLSIGCYDHMFNNCYAMQTANINLARTTLPNGCYNSMFESCLNLKYGPKISEYLSNVGNWSMHSMFKGCTEFEGPINNSHKLNSQTLGIGCYSSMFEGVGAMSAAPYLPSTTMVNECYNNMFNGALKFEIDIRIDSLFELRKWTGTANEMEASTTERILHLYVSGDNRYVKFRYDESLLSGGHNDWILVDDKGKYEESDVNFEINNVLSKHHIWKNPDTIYFYSNFEQAKQELVAAFNNLFANGKWLFNGTNKWYRIENKTTTTNISKADNEISENLRYIKAKITQNDLSSKDYTYHWLKGLSYPPAKKGSYHGPAYNLPSSDRNESTIPNGWETSSS